eukprot:scaffold270832_cov35-Tisochrysis_lutea.AAC.3
MAQLRILQMRLIAAPTNGIEQLNGSVQRSLEPGKDAEVDLDIIFDHKHPFIRPDDHIVQGHMQLERGRDLGHAHRKAVCCAKKNRARPQAHRREGSVGEVLRLLTVVRPFRYALVVVDTLFHLVCDVLRVISDDQADGDAQARHLRALNGEAMSIASVV